MTKQMRSGITTGTCAAAATKAALLSWQGATPAEVEVTTPQGISLKVKISAYTRHLNGGQASVIKDAGDDPDITNGVTVTATVEVTDRPDIIIRAGAGVGSITKPGLSVPVGEPAINPGPKKMIMQAVHDVLGVGHGAIVTISVPDGEILAKRTLNPTLGVVGGISIIGTTGIVTPMSEESFKNSLTPQISVIKAMGYDDIIFVPGKIGQDIAVKYNLPQELTAQTSNFIGHMLESAAHYKIKRVLLFGHLGKLIKVAAGIFNTHNRVADARLETLAAYVAASGAPTSVVQEILDCATTEAAINVIDRCSLHDVYTVLAERASIRAERYVFGELKIGTVIVTMAGKILGFDETAREIGGSLGWNIK